MYTVIALKRDKESPSKLKPVFHLDFDDNENIDSTVKAMAKNGYKVKVHYLPETVEEHKDFLKEMTELHEKGEL